METNKTLLYASLVLGLCLIISAVIATTAWKTVRGYENALSVTGSTKEKIVSDSARWMLEVSRRTPEAGLKQANANLKSDVAFIRSWLVSAGIAKDAIEVSPVFTMENYDYQKSANESREYTLRVTVTVNSADVNALATIAKNTDALVNQGIFVNTMSLEFYYTKLADLRVKLLGLALKDARARAEEIAKADGHAVGTLKSASSGVVQLLPVNSADVSDYGAFDTQNIEKEVFVTVRASFVLK